MAHPPVGANVALVNLTSAHLMGNPSKSLSTFGAYSGVFELNIDSLVP